MIIKNELFKEAGGNLFPRICCDTISIVNFIVHLNFHLKLLNLEIKKFKFQIY